MDHSQETSFACTNILGVRVAQVRLPDVLRCVQMAIEDGRRICVPYVHILGLNLAYENAWLREFLNRAALVYADGAGIKLAAAILGQPLPQRFAFTDWIWDLAGLAQQQGYSLYLLGNPPGAAERAARRLKEHYPRLQIAGTWHGYFNRSPGAPENEAVIEQVNAAHPDILLVGFGMPAQELWLDQNWDRLQFGVALPCGALFEYLAGDLKRGPRWMTDHYLEWLARLVISPRRYAVRYLYHNPLFFLRLARQKWIGLSI